MRSTGHPRAPLRTPSSRTAEPQSVSPIGSRVCRTHRSTSGPVPSTSSWRIRTRTTRKQSPREPRSCTPSPTRTTAHATTPPTTQKASSGASAPTSQVLTRPPNYRSADGRADRRGCVRDRRRLRGPDGGAAADRGREVGRSARGARSHRGPYLDAAPLGWFARRPRWRVVGAEARCDVRPGTRGRRVHLQDMGQGCTPAHRPRSNAALHGPHPEDQPARHPVDRVVAAEGRQDGQAGPARCPVDRKAGGRVGLALGGGLPRPLRDSDNHRTRALRDGRAGVVHRRPQRHVVPAHAVPRAGARQHQHVVLHRGWLAGEHGRRRRGLDRATDGRRPWRCSAAECAGAVDHASR